MKNRNIIGANEVMGENILGFQQIPRVDSSVDINDLDQMILPLTTYYLEKGIIKIEFFLITSYRTNWIILVFVESEYLNVLEDRTWDKVAKAFAKKEKKRMSKMHRKKNKILGSNISQSVAMRAWCLWLAEYTVAAAAKLIISACSVFSLFTAFFYVD